MSGSRPNLLFLFSDQHTQRIAGCYGDPVALTPNLDRLAREGLTFDNAYCPSPLCVPSRMSMLTARHPYAQECWTNDDYLRSDAATWLHALGAAGHRPALAGRLHSMGPDQLHGYAERTVGDHSPNWGGVPRHNLGVLDKANDPWRVSLQRSGIGQSAYQVKDVATAESACDLLRSAAERRRGGSTDPFCLTVGFLLPHPPYVAWREDYERFDGRVAPPAFGGPTAADHAWEAWWRENRGIAQVSDDETMRARTAYYGLVFRVDALIGQILDCLQNIGLDDNTLIVYTTDHGDQLGERGLWWKHTLFEDSAKVPLLLRWHAQGRSVLPAGQRRAQVVNLIDVAATMLDALGAPALPHAQGRSFLGVAADPAAPWVDETFCEHCTDSVPAWTGGRTVQQRMVRSGRWKLIYYHGERPQLFDLEADPFERIDLAGDPAHSATREGLLARVLDGWNPEHIATRIRERRLDKDVIDQWARSVRPADDFRWHLEPMLNQLEETPAK
ncbi:MAG: sulfatase-like hydrolase/transferase [Betaproteobacteria bacterium]